MKNTKYTWDLSDLYKSDNDPQIENDIIEIEKKVDAFVKKWKPRKDYLLEPKVLREALNELEKISSIDAILIKPLLYVILRQSQDSENSELKALYSKTYDKEIELTNKLQFFGINLSKKIPKSKRKFFLEYPELYDYKYSLEKGFEEAKHILSDKEEKIVNSFAKTSASNWQQMISEFISKSTVKHEGEEKSFEKVLKLIQSRDKKVRDWAGEQVGKMLKKIEESSEYEINSIIQSDNTNSELHKFKNFDESRHLAEDIDTKTVRTMIKTVTESFSISNRYYNLYPKLINQKGFGYHERSVDIGKQDIKKYSFEEGLEIVIETFGNLDSEFSKIVKDLGTKGRFDVFPRKGKSGGAFCMSLDRTVPIYILLNHVDKGQDVLTLAHELGHAIHAKLSQKHQHPTNSGHSLSTAEVASTFFEDFTLSSMNKNADKEDYFYTLNNKLRDDISTIFRQVACYNFELELHEQIKTKGFLSKTKIGELFKKHMSSYLGDSVEFKEDHKLWWIYWSHIRSPFYVYSYASGLLISKALQKKVKEDPKYIKKVKGFLSAGNSKSTKDIFLDLDIDISKKEFWEDGIAKIEEMLNEFEKLGKELGKF